MANYEFKTEHRISKMMVEKGFKREDIGKIYFAFDKLGILEKRLSEALKQMNRQTFILGKEEYVAKMQWINEFLKSKGFEEDVFTNVNSFEACCDDYDYYNEFKTPSQYKEEEEERKKRKKEKENENKGFDLTD